MCIHLLHKWTKWEEQRSFDGMTIHIIKRKKCEKCGKEEEIYEN